MELISVYIQELCQDHDYVVIPGFGGFMKRYRPARMHPTSFHFHPPGTTFVFNERLRENDGLLVARIVKGQDVSTQEAERIIARFIREQQALLQSGETVHFSGIGRFVRDPEGGLKFTADPSASFEHTAFGLPSFQAAPVRRTVTEEVTATKEPDVKPEKERSITPLIGWLAAACVVLAMLFMPIRNGGDTGSHQLANLFDSIRAQKEDIHALIYDLPERPAVVAIATSRETVIPVETPVLTEEGFEGSGYLVVCGAFREPGNASSQATRLQEAGFNASIMPGSGLQMVVVPVPLGADRYDFRNDFVEMTGIKGAWLKKE